MYHIAHVTVTMTAPPPTRDVTNAQYVYVIRVTEAGFQCCLQSGPFVVNRLFPSLATKKRSLPVVASIYSYVCVFLSVTMIAL